MRALTVAHALVSFCLALYAVSAIVHVVLYLVHRRRYRLPLPSVAWTDLPTVTVQIPVYNEVHVVERVIDAVAALDYPREKLEVQIIDDSDDDTTAVALARVEFYRQKGLDIRVLRRERRDGYKAGALAWALPQSRGELIAIFDADFCPPPGFLLQTVPYFVAQPDLGFLQTRWGYCNVEQSPLTRAQALAFDGHFVVEQTARSRAGLLVLFNGSAGIWRRTCVEAVGGWQADTLCEDLDLSFRAQLAGWKALHLPDVEVPGELTPEIAAFKRQQARWARGSIQCLRKLGLPLLRTPSLGGPQKIMALAHLCSYFSFPLALLLAILALPMLLVPASARLSFGGLGVVYLGPLFVYALSQRELYPRWWHRLWVLPVLMMVGIGLAWTNTKAVWQGLMQWGGDFERTPKFRLSDRSGSWEESRYRLAAGPHVVGELALAAYALLTTAVALALGEYAIMPFVLLYAIAFGTVGVLEIAQSAPLYRKKGKCHTGTKPLRRLLRS